MSNEKKPQHFAIDLDGTLIKYDKWEGEEVFGDPIPGAIGFVNKMLAAGHKVTVFTARKFPELVQAALIERGFPKLDVTNVKRMEFTVFIDDRAVGFDGPDDWECFTLEDFKPWWKHDSGTQQSA